MRIAGAGRRRSMRSWPIYWVSVRCVRSAVEASRAASAGRGSALASHGTSHVYTVTDRKDSSARARVRRRTEIHFFVFSKWKCTLYRSRTHTTHTTHECRASQASDRARRGTGGATADRETGRESKVAQTRPKTKRARGVARSSADGRAVHGRRCLHGLCHGSQWPWLTVSPASRVA